MRFQILHESSGRVRLKAVQSSMSMAQADLLEAWIVALPGVEQVTVHERLGSLIILFRGDRNVLYSQLARFSYEKAEEEVHILSANSRRINRAYKERLVFQVLWHYAKRLFLPAPVRQVINTAISVPRMWLAVKALSQGKLNVEVLDGVAIGTSLLTGDFSTAGSVRFLLGLGDTLDAWTHKKSVDDLAKNMSLHVDQVWQLKDDGQQEPVPLTDIRAGDKIIVHTGHVLPLDGILDQGDVMVNQASLTGESVPVAKRAGSAVYAGSVVEEGNCVVRVTHTAGENRYDRIVRMIEESERLKSGSEKRAYNLADKLVPWCLAGSALTLLLTGDNRNTAAVIAEELGIDDYRAEVLPEDKAAFIRGMQEQDRHIIMIGDGINDAPALSLADAGIAIGSGASVAREVADITIAAEDLSELVLLRKLSEKLMARIDRNYRFVMGFNGALIALGAFGLLQPAASALLHNGSTILLSMDCLTPLLPEMKRD